MTDAPLDQPSDPPDMRPLSRWERRTTDWNGEPTIEWDTEAHADWCEKWAPRCTDGNPLGDRAVIDVDTDEELPLYPPLYVNNLRQPDDGYRPANLRRRYVVVTDPPTR